MAHSSTGTGHIAVLYGGQYGSGSRVVKGLYLNTPPKPEHAYSKRKPRGHTKKSLEVA